MSDQVYKSIEITGASPDSIQDAVRVAVAKAAETVRNLEWFEVIETRGDIADQKLTQFQVTVKIGFRLD